MEFLARAVDLGYGYVKYSKGHLSASGDLPCDAFPSTAPQSYGYNDVDGGVMRGLDVTPVEIDGQTYHVGPQSLVAAPGLFSRMLDDSYFISPQYLALFRGALHYMGLPGRQVDSMVVGLPIKQYRDPAVIAHVQRQFSGTHVLPRRSMSLPERHVGITSVRVVPQTVGALVAQSQAVGAADRVPHETNLTIDVGYGTLQWMLSQGTTPVPAPLGLRRSGLRAGRRVCPSRRGERRSGVWPTQCRFLRSALLYSRPIRQAARPSGQMTRPACGGSLPNGSHAKVTLGWPLLLAAA